MSSARAVHGIVCVPQLMSTVISHVSVTIAQMELDSVPVASFWLNTVADKATALWESRADAHDAIQRSQPQLAHLVPQFWIMGTARQVHAELNANGEEWVLHPSEFNGNSLYNVRNEEFIKFVYVRQSRIAYGIPLILVFLRAIVASVFMCRVLQRFLNRGLNRGLCAGIFKLVQHGTRRRWSVRHIHVTFRINTGRRLSAKTHRYGLQYVCKLWFAEN